MIGWPMPSCRCPAIAQGIFNRLKAESVLRFGHDGTFDGTTVAFNPTIARMPKARRAQAERAAIRVVPGCGKRRVVADELLKFSLYKGVDPILWA